MLLIDIWDSGSVELVSGFPDKQVIYLNQQSEFKRQTLTGRRWDKAKWVPNVQM